MTRLFTIILDYAGGTYMAYVEATDSTAALILWEQQLTPNDLVSWRLKRSETSDLLADDPVPIDGLQNVWCKSAAGKHGLVLVNIVATHTEP